MKKQRRIITGQRLAILFIIVAMIATTLGIIACMKIFGKAKESSETEVSYIEELFKNNLPEIKEVCEKNNWGSDIIGSSTKEEVPIPKGYEYKKGDLSTGIIVREVETGAELLWIPYQEEVNVNIDEYYKNVEEIELDSDAIKSIDKYNGFYVYLNMNANIDDLKDISTDTYKNYSTQLSTMGKYKDTHILSSEEIAQVLTYTNKNKIKLETGVEAMTVGLYSTLNIAEEEEIVSSSNVVAQKASYGTFDRTNAVQLAKKTSNKYENGSFAWLKVKAANKNETEVPIPSGFEYSVSNDGIVTIRQEDNNNMVYVWVPVKSDSKKKKNIEVLENAKEELKDLYSNYTREDGESFDVDSKGSDLYKSFNNTEDEFSEDFEKSINTYGGFYVSEAELGTGSDGKSYNKARGMINYSATERLGGGDYYRASKESFTDQNIKKLVTESCTVESVVSHLMYGAEYDMIMCWINETNKADNKKILLDNSSSVGKYSDSGIGENASKTESGKFFNGIWGLAGNLFELTAERLKVNNDYELVLRGGSYKNTGTEFPMASRSFVDSMDTARKDEDTYGKGEAIGIRTCLYIQTESIKEEEIEDWEDKEIEEKEERDNDIYFNKLSGEQSRYVRNWDGLKIYENADSTKEPISTESFATRIVVEEKAEELSAPDFCWGKGKVEGKGNTVYFNCMDLTKLYDENTVNNVEFIIGDDVYRYCDGNIEAYEQPDKNSNHITLNNERLTVYGKSVNQEWAKIKVDNKVYYVLSQNLRLSAEKNIEGIDFLIWDWTEPRYVNIWDKVKIYEKPDESSNVIMELTESDTVWVSAKAKDETNDSLQWARVELNENKKGYINANCLTKGEEIDGVIFARAKEKTKRWYNGLTLYKSPKDDAVANKVDWGGEIDVLGKSADGIWAIVSTGETLYVKADELLGIPIVFKDAYIKYYHNGLTMYDDVKNGNSSKLEGDGEVTIIGTSIMDYTYSVIYNNGYKYVKTSDLRDEPYEEPKQDTGSDTGSNADSSVTWTDINDYRYVNCTLNVRSKPSANSTRIGGLEARR